MSEIDPYSDYEYASSWFMYYCSKFFTNLELECHKDLVQRELDYQLISKAKNKLEKILELFSKHKQLIHRPIIAMDSSCSKIEMQVRSDKLKLHLTITHDNKDDEVLFTDGYEISISTNNFDDLELIIFSPKKIIIPSEYNLHTTISTTRYLTPYERNSIRRIVDPGQFDNAHPVVPYRVHISGFKFLFLCVEDKAKLMKVLRDFEFFHKYENYENKHCKLSMPEVSKISKGLEDTPEIHKGFVFEFKKQLFNIKCKMFEMPVYE